MPGLRDARDIGSASRLSGSRLALRAAWKTRPDRWREFQGLCGSAFPPCAGGRLPHSRRREVPVLCSGCCLAARRRACAARNRCLYRRRRDRHAAVNSAARRRPDRPRGRGDAALLVPGGRCPASHVHPLRFASRGRRCPSAERRAAASRARARPRGASGMRWRPGPFHQRRLAKTRSRLCKEQDRAVPCFHCDGEAQQAIVTETRGALARERIVRRRNRGCFPSVAGEDNSGQHKPTTPVDQAQCR